MIKVGITGGIGSGKTTVCKFFEFLGVPIYYADSKAKELMQKDASLISSIRSLFGDESYDSNGVLNRPYLANKVFNDEEQLKKLNAIVHPAVFMDTAKWMDEHKGSRYTLYEAAILFESGNYKMFDKTITVFAPESLRIKRVMERDKVSEKEVRSRMSKQMDDTKKVALADYVIHNDLQHSLISQILALHKELNTLTIG